MINKIIETLNKKYNIEIKYTVKFSNVYNISFKIEDTEISFTFMHNPLKTLEGNIEILEKKVNEEIIYFYRRK